jgi:hypothetical protein
LLVSLMIFRLFIPQKKKFFFSFIDGIECGKIRQKKEEQTPLSLD